MTGTSRALDTKVTLEQQGSHVALRLDHYAPTGFSKSGRAKVVHDELDVFVVEPEP